MASGWTALPEMVVKAVRAGRPAHYPLRNEARACQFPLDWRRLAMEADADGAVRVDGDKGPYVHPVATCFSIIADAQGSVDVTSSAYRNRAESAIRVLLGEQGADGAFRYPVAVPRYQLEPGWSSALAQGLFVAAVAEAAEALAPEVRHAAEEAAGAAVDHLLVPIGQGGCSTLDEAGLFFEECPSESPPYILNGAALAVLGLATSLDPAHHDVARDAARSLSGRLGAWDLGYWSRYDLMDRSPASPDYHSLHSSLMRALDMRFPGAGFGSWAERFIEQAGRPLNRGRALGSLGLRRVSDLARGRR